MPITKLVYNKKIRSVWNEKKQKHYYCLNDVVKVLTNIKDAKNYLKDMRNRDAALTKKWRKLVVPIEMETEGGKQKVNCADAAGVIRIIKNMRSSNKTELFNRWLKRKRSEQYV